mgnify:CR=1 FL=1
MGLYQQALEAPDLSEEGPSGEGRQRRAECLAGLARCSIMQGEAERGMELAAASGSTALLVQCAELLEGQGLDKQVGLVGGASIGMKYRLACSCAANGGG